MMGMYDARLWEAKVTFIPDLEISLSTFISVIQIDMYQIQLFSVANFALAGLPLINAIGENMHVRF